jgi:hypothetical protein
MTRRSRVTTLQALGLGLLVIAGAAQGAAQATQATQAGTAASGQPTVPKAPPASTSDGFSRDQLEQLAAPIALYSDSLLAQMLMAATYPLEIVLADRFVRANPDLKEAKLDEALKDYDWDASVKSLCRLPEVLAKMSENLDWTQDLGDAVLGQKSELLDAVQRMRGKAYDSGNLKTSEQQVVTVKEEKIIVIESPSPEVVYVPTYSPTVVYGGWAPPYYYYPPMYPYYPYGAGLVTFGFGVAMGAAIWGGCGWGWGHSDINIDIDRNNNFNRNTNRNRVDHHAGAGDRGGRANWNHDPGHRRGANYQNSKVATQYGARGGTNRVSRDQARGYSGNRTGTLEARAPGGSNRQAGERGGGQRAGTGDRAGTGQRAGGADRAGAGQRGGAERASGNRSSYGSRSGAYSGSSRPSVDRGASSRGSASRGSRSYGGSRGGGGFSGGGRGGGGRGGGGRGGRR